MRTTHEPLKQNTDNSTSYNEEIATSQNVDHLLRNSKKINNERSRPSTTRSRATTANIKFKAKQVIVREGIFEPENVVPVGTNIIGELLTSIDTREQNQLYKVLLPYGGRHSGGGQIAKNSIIFGRIRYKGQGNKVFMTFDKGVFPNGKEFKIHAQALNTKDYSPGITGDYHGKTGVRVATTLGLTMVSGMTEILTEKQNLGTGETVTPKATFKNGLYHGTSKLTKVEAGRQAQELMKQPEYVTINAGADLIVNLTASYKQK